MNQPTTYPIDAGWKIILADVGIRPSDVLRRAGLPEDLFARDRATLTTDEYFRMWQGLEDEADEKMWRFFEPELRRRLSELDAGATMTDRVRSALLELLPSGTASTRAVAAKVAVSTRTLQRRLSNEGATFQQILNATREELARHYLKSSAMSGAEISFLLGFDDSNSFFRAFHAWTGVTPTQVRAAEHAT